MTGVQNPSSGAVQVVSMTAPNVSAPTVIANAQPQKIMGPRIQTAAAVRIQPAIAPRPNVIQMAGQVSLKIKYFSLELGRHQTRDGVCNDVSHHEF